MKDLDKSILVFIHIKKTGGISLQWLLAKQYGAKFYGGHTHSALKRVSSVNPIEKNQLHTLPEGACVCKHWTYDDFAVIHKRAKFITIIRDPVERVICHYNFYLMHHAKGQSFMKYIHDPKNLNIYGRFLPKDLACLSEIYIFEDFQNSIDRSEILSYKGLPETNKTVYVYSPTSQELEVFRDINKSDMELYRILRTG